MFLFLSSWRPSEGENKVQKSATWFLLLTEGGRKTRVGERLVRSFSHQTRDRKELATKEFVLPKLKISESTKVFLGSF